MYISARHISTEEIWHTYLKGWIHLKSFRSADGAVRTYLDLPLSLVREHTHPPHTIYPAIKFRKIFKWISVHHQWKKLDKTVCSRYIGYLYIYIVYLRVHYKPLRIYTRIRTCICMMHVGVAHSSGVATWRGLFKVDIFAKVSCTTARLLERDEMHFISLAKCPSSTLFSTVFFFCNIIFSVFPRKS